MFYSQQIINRKFRQMGYLFRQEGSWGLIRSYFSARLPKAVLTCTIAFSLISTACKQTDTPLQTGTKGHFETALDFQKFVDPPAAYRSFPFYSINDKLTKEEIKKQVLEFKEAGFGGFYLHSRAGLLTEFLGDEWWDVIEAAVDAANEAGIQACFYDEDKWPSGFAGGIIPRMSEDYRAKSLVRLALDTPLPPGSIVLKEGPAHRYIMHTAQMGQAKFNGTCYVDLFNPEMVQKFIDVSYRPYVEKYKGKTAHYTPAIFADEPHIHSRYFDKNTPNQGVLSYSPWVRTKFMALYGYDLLDKVDLLFEEKDNWREVRLQYYRAVAQQFEESFTLQIATWCEKNGLKYTGHYLGEDVLKKVRDRIGNSMLHYRNMQQPGMDHLGLSISGKLITAKSLSSAANQYAIPRRMSELFGISGQNMNFEDRKWLSGWHTILGINHLCPHLTLYSMTGARKRDYPPTFSYHQPYWKDNKQIEDYMGRISYATCIGQYDPQILVINPLESEYIRSTHEKEFTKPMLQLLEDLQSLHLDYDLGDEQIMADTADLKKNKLRIGAMSYSYVILPNMLSIRRTTLTLLNDFIENGGMVLSIGQFPEFVDGIKDADDLAKLKAITTVILPEQALTQLPKTIDANVVISGEQSEKVWSQVRTVKDGVLIQLSNVSHTDAIQFELKSHLLNDHLVLWDPSAAACYNLTTKANGTISLQLAASSNIWITSGELSNNAEPNGDYQLPSPLTPLLELTKKWQGKRLDPNALTLDFARYSIDKGQTFSRAEPVIGIAKRLSEQHFSGQLILDYPVQIDQIPQTCKLVVEQPAMYNSILVNSNPINFQTTDYYVDHAFLTSDIGQALTENKNIIRLTLDFKPEVPASENPYTRYGTEIESIYLVGDFAVKGHDESQVFNSQRNLAGNFQIRPVHGFQSFSITKEAGEFSGNLTLEGYPFYAGSFEMSQSFILNVLDPVKKYFVELPNCESVVSNVELNGSKIETLTWSPFVADISSAVVPGENVIKITLTNSLRNLLGPHHHQRAEMMRVGPGSFTGAGGFPDPKGDSDWFDLRKTNKPLKQWTDTYYSIPFGFIEAVRISSSKK